MAILCLVSLNSYSQESWKLQIWSKNGNIYQYDTESIDSVTFVKYTNFRDWQKIMKFPSESDINKVNSTSICRSPYITAWLDTDIEGGFTAYAVDFKADYLPTETYCSLANFHLDYSSLFDKYERTWNDGGMVNAYAGFQSASPSDKADYQSILSIWDTYCLDKSGKTDTIRASLIYPEASEEVHFDHENEGTSCRPKYNWKPGKWYRMFIQCVEPQDGTNTQMEFWVNDLDEKKTWTKLCVFDLGAQGVFFSEKTAAFLENWWPKTSGEIRTMEFKNARIFNKERKWQSINSATFSSAENSFDLCYMGSYQYGADDTTFWIITSGVSNCATLQPETKLVVKYSEAGNPLEVQ